MTHTIVLSSAALTEGEGVVIDGLKLAATVLVAAAGALTALTVIWKSRIGRLVRWMGRRLIGEPFTDRVDRAMVAVIERDIMPVIAQNQQRVERIIGEFQPNHGASMRDKVDCLVRGQDSIAAHLERLDERQVDIIGRLRRLESREVERE